MATIPARRIASWGMLAALFCLATAVSSVFLAGMDANARRSPRQSDRFSDIVLTTQHGRSVHFYDDLVKNKTVLINLMYTGCGETCPANTAALAKINDLLGQRMGRDIIMVSVSIDPIADSPERLKQYWQAFGSKPGWLFLTGKAQDVERLRHELGAYDLDPAVDADPSQHAGFVTLGNDRSNRWIALPLMIDTPQLARTILRIANDG